MTNCQFLMTNEVRMAESDRVVEWSSDLVIQFGIGVQSLDLRATSPLDHMAGTCC